jgi:hypothetical protein
MLVFEDTDDGLKALAATADTLYGFNPADPSNLAHRMARALDGEWPDGADPVEVCTDDILCFLAGVGYDLTRGENGEWQILPDHQAAANQPTSDGSI